MSEEAENNGGGFFSNLKNQIITGAGVTLTTLGTVFIDEVKSLVGIEDEEVTEVAAPVQNNQQQQSNNQQVIINIPEQKPAETKTVVIRDTTARKPVKKKEKEQELDW
jgi:hypothetical protein